MNDQAQGGKVLGIIGCQQMSIGSSFLNDLNAGDDTIDVWGTIAAYAAVRVPLDLTRAYEPGTVIARLEAAAKASEKVKQFLEGKTIRKVIVLPKKLVNIVVA